MSPQSSPNTASLVKRPQVGQGPSLDTTKQVLSELVRNHRWTLQAIVVLVRGQTILDFRLNKALCPLRQERLLFGYRHVSVVSSIARIGVQPRWLSLCSTQVNRPSNHTSASRHQTAVLNSICEGQTRGQYLVVDPDILHHWSNIQVSPF